MQFNQIEKPRRDAKVPLYAKIMDAFSDAIRKGALRSGDRLPPQAELAEYLGVSLAPVKQALAELEKQGIVMRRQGLGTFIRDITPVREERIQYTRIPWFHREMAERGLKPSSHVLNLEELNAGDDAQVQEELKLQPADKVVVLKRVRLADDTPLAVQSAYLIAERVKGLIERSVGIEDSITDILRDEYGLTIAAAQQRITAASATAEDTRYLNIVEGNPLLLIERTSYLETGEPLEFLRDRRHPSWTFAVWLSRNSGQ